MKTSYIIKGKQWRLIACKALLKASGIPSTHNFIAGSLTLTCNNLGELMVLQDACKKLDLKYQQT